MRKILACLFLLWASISYAADNQVTLTVGSGITMRTTDVGAGVQSSNVILSSTSGGGTAIYGTAGTANANVLTIQGIASGTVVPVSLTSTTVTGTVAVTQSGAWSLSANQSTNVAQINGVTPLMGNGVTGTGSLRVTIASDNTANSNPWLVTLSGTNNIATVTTLTTLTGGGVASGSADSGNPVKIGGKYNSSPITLTDGNRGDLQLDVNGYAKVNVTNANANGQATMANSSPVVIASNQTANALWGHGVTGSAVPANATYIGFNSGGNLTGPSVTAPLPVNNTGPYPIGSTPYTATATGTTAATTATLAGASSVTTYLCGFSIRANATAAATGNATVTGVITATLNFTQWTAPNASGLGITEMIFAPCIPASGTNQSIAVVSAAPGTGGVVSVTAWGYKL